MQPHDFNGRLWIGAGDEVLPVGAHGCEHGKVRSRGVAFAGERDVPRVAVLCNALGDVDCASEREVFNRGLDIKCTGIVGNCLGSLKLVEGQPRGLRVGVSNSVDLIRKFAAAAESIEAPVDAYILHRYGGDISANQVADECDGVHLPKVAAR